MNDKLIYKITKIKNWIETNNYKGYDPYDIKGSKFYLNLIKRNNLLTKLIATAIMFAPKQSRYIANIQPTINNKSLGLIIKSYCNLYNVTKKNEYIEKSYKLLKILKKNRANNNHYCWGYPFDWQSKIFIPKNTPSIVVTSFVGDAILALFKITNDKNLLIICDSICKFITNDLNYYKKNCDQIIASYTPLDTFKVHNANLLGSAFLLKTGLEINNDKYIDRALKMAEYSIIQQNSNGSLSYWSNDSDIKHSVVDSYHSGFEIRSAYSIYQLTGKNKYISFVKRYMFFYLNTFVNKKITTHNPNKGFIDIHGLAEIIILLSIIDVKKYKKKIKKVIKLTNRKFYDSKGFYYYRLYYDFLKIKFPYMRWSQSWMFYALTTFLERQSYEHTNDT